MPVNLTAPNPADLHPVAGVELGIAMAGVRKANRRDVTVITLNEGSHVAGVFTQNRFCAAPVQVCREHLAADVGARALLDQHRQRECRHRRRRPGARTVDMQLRSLACCASRQTRCCRFPPA